MNALATPAFAPTRHSLFPERITAGRPATAARLRLCAARAGALAPLLATIEALDAALPADASPLASRVVHLATLARTYAERACLARALDALARLHDACDVPAPLFGVASARHVAVLLASDPAAAEAAAPLGSALAWTRATGTRRACAVQDMAALLARLDVHRAFPLPAVVARNLPGAPLAPPLAPPAAAPFEAWADAVEVAFLYGEPGAAGLVAHFATLPWHVAFDAGLAPDHAARVVTAWIVGCAVHGPKPFLWDPAPFDPDPFVTGPPAPRTVLVDAEQATQPEATAAVPATRTEEHSPAARDARTADRLDAQANRLADLIHHRRNLHNRRSAASHGQTLTPRRARARAAGQHEADALEPVLDALHALALATRAGTLPAVLARVTTRAAVSELVPRFEGHTPTYPDADTPFDRACRSRLLSAGIRDADDYADALAALASLPRPEDNRGAPDREAARIRSLVEAARLSGIPDSFFSPPAVADALLDAARLPDDPGPAFRVLDPSAGDGALLDAVLGRLPRASVAAVEINARLRDILAAKGHALAGHDALEFADADGFDRIIMNPPFGRGGALAMQHVRHAYGLLRSGGCLVAVVPESCFFRADRAHRDFRDWLYGLGGYDRDPPHEAFAAAGTTVSTRLVVVDAP